MPFAIWQIADFGKNNPLQPLPEGFAVRRLARQRPAGCAGLRRNLAAVCNLLAASAVTKGRISHCEMRPFSV